MGKRSPQKNARAAERPDAADPPAETEARPDAG